MQLGEVHICGGFSISAAAASCFKQIPIFHASPYLFVEAECLCDSSQMYLSQDCSLVISKISVGQYSTGSLGIACLQSHKPSTLNASPFFIGRWSLNLAGSIIIEGALFWKR